MRPDINEEERRKLMKLLKEMKEKEDDPDFHYDDLN